MLNRDNYQYPHILIRGQNYSYHLNSFSIIHHRRHTLCVSTGILKSLELLLQINFV